MASPKPNQSKETEVDSDEPKNQESTAPKVPPLKIVIPGGASGSGSRNEQEGEGKNALCNFGFQLSYDDIYYATVFYYCVFNRNWTKRQW